VSATSASAGADGAPLHATTNPSRHTTSAWKRRISHLALRSTLRSIGESRSAAGIHFLEDGRLRLENNGSERALRLVVAARKSWLFFGSDDHTQAAANVFSLVASCKLHGLDPESYLAEVIRVMPYWPRQRYLELAPRYWAETRGRLDVGELARPLGHVTVPPPRTTEEQTATD
jgi:hypothetical protein